MARVAPFEEGVRQWLEQRAGEMAELVCRLVAVPTENPPGRDLRRCAELLCHAFADLGVPAELIPVETDRGLDDPHIVRARAGDGGRLVYFHGHFDVVPAQDQEQFVPRRANGAITGRGSADMRGGLAAMIYAAAALHALRPAGSGRVVLHLVCDEETGSAAGSGHLHRNGLISQDAAAMLTPEPTGGAIWHANRGAITLRVTVRGREAHIGLAHAGVNAYEQAISIASDLRELAGELRRNRTTLDPGSDDGRGSVLVVAGASGSGANFNVVPGSAWFSVDRRFNPEEDMDEEVDRLLSTIGRSAAAAGAEVEIEVLQRGPAGATAPDNPAARTLARAVARVEGAAPAFQLCPGVLETRWYSSLGIPAFAYGPGRLDVSHGPGELVEEAAIARCALVYALTAGELLD